MIRRRLGSTHPMNQWDEIARARAASRDDSIWCGVWTVIMLLLLGLAFICSIEREMDAHNRYQSSVTIPIMEER